RPNIPAPDLVFWSHYIDESNSPLYSFGHGLSYTSFEYKNLTLSAPSFGKGEKIEVKFNLTNAGNREGTEVVQLYIRDLFGSVTRPVKELKGFQQIALKSGETREVTFIIDEETIEFY